MLISEAYTRIALYINTILGNKIKGVVYAHQAKPRMLKPFCLLDIRNIATNNFLSRFDINDDDEQKVIINKSMTVVITVFSDKLHEAEELVNDLYNYLGTDIATNIFKDDIAYMRDLSDVVIIPNIIESNIESRAYIELQMDTNQEIIDDVGRITSIVVHNETNNTDIIIEDD